MVRTITRALWAAPFAAGLVLAPSVAQAADYSAPLTTAVAALPTATEDRSGYERTAFRHWVDADGDGCDTRAEVLISEAEDKPTVGASCALSGGRWFSYYDGISQSAAGSLDIDHMVPLAEAWDSGADGWSATVRQSFANDLGYGGSLVAVTASENRSKGDQDPAEWKPKQQLCRYVQEWVSVKHRWRLSVDSAEKSALASAAGGCGSRTVSVTLAR